MKTEINLDKILAPISGEHPAGLNLRYDPVYDEIKEARREDDTLDKGSWTHKIKEADWRKVITLCVDLLSFKTKDLQIASWLTEALTREEGLEGFVSGFKIISGLLNNYWDDVYPVLEGGDLEYRIGPLEFLNNKLPIIIKQIPITKTNNTQGYSLFQWQQLRGGVENVSQGKGESKSDFAKVKAELITKRKELLEELDAAIACSSGSFYLSLEEKLSLCQEVFKHFEGIVDLKFGKNVPMLAEIRKVFEDFRLFLTSEKIRGLIKEEKIAREAEKKKELSVADNAELSGEEDSMKELLPHAKSAQGISTEKNLFLSDDERENNFWEESLKMLKSEGLKNALAYLYSTSCRAPSVRENNRYRLYMAKLCLKAGRPELARPMAEELFALIGGLKLELWESPMWIAEVHDVLYKSLMAGEPSQKDKERANEIFKKICTIDVTKAFSQ